MKFRCNWFLFLHSRPCREWLKHSSIGNQWLPSSKESLHATDLQICKILEILILRHDHWSCYGSDDHQTLSYPAVQVYIHMCHVSGWIKIFIFTGRKIVSWCSANPIDNINLIYFERYPIIIRSLRVSFIAMFHTCHQMIIRTNNHRQTK